MRTQRDRTACGGRVFVLASRGTCEKTVYILHMQKKRLKYKYYKKVEREVKSCCGFVFKVLNVHSQCSITSEVYINKRSLKLSPLAVWTI